MHVWKFLLEKLMCGEFILNLLLHPRAYISRRMILKEYDIDLICIFQAYISFIDLIYEYIHIPGVCCFCNPRSIGWCCYLYGP